MDLEHFSWINKVKNKQNVKNEVIEKIIDNKFFFLKKQRWFYS